MGGNVQGKDGAKTLNAGSLYDIDVRILLDNMQFVLHYQLTPTQCLYSSLQVQFLRINNDIS